MRIERMTPCCQGRFMQLVHEELGTGRLLLQDMGEGLKLGCLDGLLYLERLTFPSDQVPAATTQKGSRLLNQGCPGYLRDCPESMAISNFWT